MSGEQGLTWASDRANLTGIARATKKISKYESCRLNEITLKCMLTSTNMMQTALAHKRQKTREHASSLGRRKRAQRAST